MKQTAVEWLVDQLKSTRKKYMGFKNIDIDYQEIIKQAKEMEKEQHNETWDIAHQAGRFEGKGIAENNWQTFETHWNETFKSE